MLCNDAIVMLKHIHTPHTHTHSQKRAMGHGATRSNTSMTD